MASSAEEVRIVSPPLPHLLRSKRDRWVGCCDLASLRRARGRSWTPLHLLITNHQRGRFSPENRPSQTRPSASSGNRFLAVGCWVLGPCSGPQPLHTSLATAAWGLLRRDDASEVWQDAVLSPRLCRARPGCDQTAARESTLLPHTVSNLPPPGFRVETCGSKWSVRV